ncbi:MAG: hypothetical protein KJ787_04080 [Gammaproteobacteria bacterium]|nr:hypothetical protein [Gammaproteobacteria bacterium]MBU1645489.1 hypothetical protein [Gammaproteobacteria bacterium]MBU1971112.1 hypothetical protein [Gammaproteobacteria bacterium]
MSQDAMLQQLEVLSREYEQIFGYDPMSTEMGFGNLALMAEIAIPLLEKSITQHSDWPIVEELGEPGICVP